MTVCTVQLDGQRVNNAGGLRLFQQKKEKLHTLEGAQQSIVGGGWGACRVFFFFFTETLVFYICALPHIPLCSRGRKRMRHGLVKVFPSCHVKHSSHADDQSPVTAANIGVKFKYCFYTSLSVQGADLCAVVARINACSNKMFESIGAHRCAFWCGHYACILVCCYSHSHLLCCLNFDFSCRFKESMKTKTSQQAAKSGTVCFGFYSFTLQIKFVKK